MLKKLLDTKASAALVMGAVVIGAIYLFKKDISNGVAAAGDAITPTNPDNIFASGVDAVGEVLTGDDNFTLGGWIYDVMNPVEDDGQYQYIPEKPPLM